MDNCLFCKIVRGEVPGRKVFEDEDILAFHDIHPRAPVHFMVIPKTHIASLAECDMRQQMLLGKMLGMATQLAQSQGLNDGYRIIINTGRIGNQEVMHLHMHIAGGPQPLGTMLPH